MDKEHTALRLPSYLKMGIANVDDKMSKKIRTILKQNALNTVCDSARCPNKKECYCNGSATFMVMGNVCTRNCKFCNIEQQRPKELDPEEPQKIAKAVSELNLKYCVITSVTRDDLDDGGAKHFAQTVLEIKKLNPNTKIEVLTSDFGGNQESLKIVLNSKPDVFNHNIETVKRLYPVAREMADYCQSLSLLEYAKNYAPQIITKTGIMVGLGESKEELAECFKDINKAKIDILTVGQYIRPSKKHLEVAKYYTPQEFEALKELARSAGVVSCISAPLARSSYMAREAYEEALVL